MSGRRHETQASLRNLSVGALIVSVSLGLASDLLFVAALQFRVDWFEDPALLVAGGASSAELLKWAALTDLFSYYLPTTVVAIALWSVFRRRDPILPFAAILSALGYVIAGSIGAASLSMAGPVLIREYAASGVDRAAIATAFGVVIQIVFRAIWQLVDGVLIATWMIGVGFLIRTEQPAFARLSWTLGGLFLLGAAFNAVGFGLGRDAILGVVFVAWFAWDIWLAVLVWRRRSPFNTLA